MDLRAVVTNLNGRALAFLDDETFTITARVEGWGEVSIVLGRGSGLASVVDVGSRAVKIYDGSTLRFFGKIWEPLTIGSGGISIKAQSPLAEFVQRVVQTSKDYTATNNGGGPWDAGQIQYDRLAIQNARQNTYLRAGTRDASVNRLRTLYPGTLERDIIAELSGAADGFFFREVPVDAVDGVMADLDILYPDSGVERADVIFGWGTNTIDNCIDYEQTTTLPRNFYTAAASASTGGRIAKSASKTGSITTYGLFDEETTYSDVRDTVLLQQQADASVKETPPRTLVLTPGVDAPLLFQDFDVGDFVRVNIEDGDLTILEWARVLEATLRKTDGGNIVLDSVSLELVVGGAITITPARRWRQQIDEQRRRLEALERRQQTTAETAVAAPAPPAPSDPSGGGAPAPVESAPPPPPPAPPAPPTITALSATGVNYRDNGNLVRGVEISITVDLKGLPGTVSLSAGGGSATLSGSGSAFIATGTGAQTIGASVSTSAGTATGGTTATVPAVTAG